MEVIDVSENKRINTSTYFNQEIVRYKSLEQELIADERSDEAIFAKIRMNIFDIFNTIFSVALRTSGDNDEKIQQFFLTKIEQIPQSWHSSLQNAKKHEDVEKIHTETIKLETVYEIKTAFEKIWGEVL